MAKSKTSGESFLRGAAGAAVGALASSDPRPRHGAASSRAAKPRRAKPWAARRGGQPEAGLRFMLDVYKSLGFEYFFCLRRRHGIQESVVNYGRNKDPSTCW